MNMRMKKWLTASILLALLSSEARANPIVVNAHHIGIVVGPALVLEGVVVLSILRLWRHWKTFMLGFLVMHALTLPFLLELRAWMPSARMWRQDLAAETVIGGSLVRFLLLGRQAKARYRHLCACERGREPRVVPCRLRGRPSSLVNEEALLRRTPTMKRTHSFSSTSANGQARQLRRCDPPPHEDLQ